MYNFDDDDNNGDVYGDDSASQEKLVRMLARYGTSLLSPNSGHGEGAQTERNIKQAHRAFVGIFHKAKDKKYAFWTCFKLAFGQLKLDAWDGSLSLGSRQVDVACLVHWLEDALRTISPLSDQELTRKITQSFAQVNPVNSYLEKLPEATEEDRQMYYGLSKMLFGASDHLSQVKLSRWLIGAVARVMEPGCKMDSALVIKGKQGIGKTSFLQALFGKHFRTLHSHIKDIEKQRLIGQAWGCELGEIEATFRATDISALKAFLTETHDAVRKMYTEDIPNKPRHCVFAGTTNEAAFLNDPTGSRRFWVIDADGHSIPVDWVKMHRDRIWAVALENYLNGEPWWMTADEAALNEASNKAFQQENSYISTIATYLMHYQQMPPVAGKGIAVNIADVMTAILEIKPESHKRNSKEVTAALSELGYTKKRINNKSFNGYFYTSPDATDPCILRLTRVSGCVSLDGSQMATRDEQKAWAERDL